MTTLPRFSYALQPPLPPPSHLYTAAIYVGERLLRLYRQEKYTVQSYARILPERALTVEMPISSHFKYLKYLFVHSNVKYDTIPNIHINMLIIVINFPSILFILFYKGTRLVNMCSSTAQIFRGLNGTLLLLLHLLRKIWFLCIFVQVKKSKNKEKERMHE